jgi:glucose-6-phosphate 1-dehydrogenase
MACTTQVIESARAGRAEASLSSESSFTLIVFGASGDLAKRKLLPALFQLERAGLLPARFAVVGFSRSALSDQAFRESTRQLLATSGLLPGEESRLLESLYYVAGDNDDPAAFERLSARLLEIERERELAPNRLAYLSVSPEFFGTIVRNLSVGKVLRREHPGEAPGAAHAQKKETFSRVVVEKPFGRDLASARALNAELTRYLDESQIYRIDHYLGKETVQNIFSFRFGNAIFEPLFNQKYVEHVAITVGETLGMEGKRGAYYDHAGALRDMVANHILQLLSIVAMEPPSGMDAAALRAEKVKVLRSIVPITRERAARETVRAQYLAGQHGGERIKAYRDELGVDPRSDTETFVALKLAIDNWRWASVPFYLRTGKRLAARSSEIAVTFKKPPLHMFKQLACPDAFAPAHGANVLLLRIQPDEGISLTFQAKTPGMKMCLDQVRMDFSYTTFGKRSPEAYERLLLDAIHGDAALFTHRDEVEEAWRFIGSIQEAWAEQAVELASYVPFSEGPSEVSRLFAGTDHGFRPLSGK